MSLIDDKEPVWVELTQTFIRWRDGLRDQRAKARVAVRLLALARRHWGDVKPVGEGVSELQIAYGSGYRLYVIKKVKAWGVLLCGGDKDSQHRDIKTPRILAKEWTT